MDREDGNLTRWSRGRPEPWIRVGIVLAEDRKTEVEIVPAASCVAAGRRLEPGQSWTVRVGGRSLSASGPRDRVTTGPDGLLEVAPRDPPVDPSAPTAVVRGIVAGRSFHWRKEINVSYAGAFEFRLRDGFVEVVNRVPVEAYLLGVITGEMSGECPPDFMKAQAVAARSWLLSHPHGGEHADDPFEWCNDDHCQRYHGADDVSPAARDALAACRSEVLVTASGAICDANYSKSCGGVFADPELIWGRAKEGQHVAHDAPADDPVRAFPEVTDANARDYLTGDWLQRTRVFCSPAVVAEKDLPRYLGRVDEAGSYFRWTVDIPVRDLVANLAAKTGVDIVSIEEIQPLRRDPSGRLVALDLACIHRSGDRTTVALRSEYAIREALHPRFLWSSAFVCDWIEDPPGARSALRLHGGGWGHGAGLCQIGALGMALSGHDYRRILHHYFADVEILGAYA